MLVVENHKSLEQQQPLLQFFAYGHLPPFLQEISQPFHALAMQIMVMVPRNPEQTVALRKLLEAKDCAVRAKLYKDPNAPPVEAQKGPGATG